MARKNAPSTIQMVEAELFFENRSLEVVRCYAFDQSATRRIRKLDGTDIVEIGEIAFKIEATKDWNTKGEFKIKLAGEKAPWVVRLDLDGYVPESDKSIYSVRTVGIDTTLEKVAQNLLVVSS